MPSTKTEDDQAQPDRPPDRPGPEDPASAGPLTPDMKRFDIFLIDTGWNRPISGDGAVASAADLSNTSSKTVSTCSPQAVGRDPQARPGPDRPRPDDHRLRPYATRRLGQLLRLPAQPGLVAEPPSRRWPGSRSSSVSSRSIAPPNTSIAKSAANCTAKASMG